MFRLVSYFAGARAVHRPSIFCSVVAGGADPGDRGSEIRPGTGVGDPSYNGNGAWVAGVFVALMMAAVAGLSSGCSRGEGAINADAKPKILRVAFTTSSEEEMEVRAAAYQELGDYLGKRLETRVEIIAGSAFSTAIELMRAGKLDVVTASPLPYMVAHEKFGAVPLVTPALPDGRPTSYHSIFIARASSGLRSLDDLKARSRELVIAFADPVSTSGHLIPRAQLESMGLEAERDFKQVVFAGTHVAAVMNVKSGKLDVATVTKTFYERMIRDGRLKADELVVIWTSPPLHQGIVFTRPGLPPAFREKLQNAYVELHRDRPDIYKGINIIAMSGATRYMPIEDSAFDEFRRIARGLKHMKLLD